MSISRKIIGDLENGPILNSIILITKKVIYDSFKKDKIPSIFQIKSEVKNHYYLEKFTHRNNGKIQLFEKKGTFWHKHMRMLEFIFIYIPKAYLNNIYYNILYICCTIKVLLTQLLQKLHMYNC